MDKLEKAQAMNNEKDFIRYLGTGKHYDWKEVTMNPPSRMNLLCKYIAACDSRVNWCGMDKDKLIAYARLQLAVR